MHPDLGTLEDFERLTGLVKQKGMEIAMDLAYQCTPDHPYVTEHPEWFRGRPDGTIQICGEPAKEISGYLSHRFRKWRTGKNSGGS